MTPEPATKTGLQSPKKPTLIEIIHLVAGHPSYLGYEDIAYLFDIPARQVRPFVIGGQMW